MKAVADRSMAHLRRRSSAALPLFFLIALVAGACFEFEPLCEEGVFSPECPAPEMSSESSEVQPSGTATPGATSATSTPEPSESTSNSTSEPGTPTSPGTSTSSGTEAPSTLALDIDEECNPIAHTEECLLPWPSIFHEVPDETTATGRRLDIPQEALTPALRSRRILVEPFNRADGTPGTAPILIHLGVDVADDYLVGQRELERSLDPDFPVALIDLETGERVPFLSEMDQNRRRASRNQGRHAWIIRPMVPLTFGSQVALVVRGPEISDDEGNAIAPAPGFVALRDGIPTDHPRLNERREDYEALFTRLDELGFAREELFTAFPWQVVSRDFVVGPLLHMRDVAIEEARSEGVSYTIDEVRENPFRGVRRAVLGTFEVATFLTEENEIEFDTEGRPIRQAENQSFPFTLILPDIEDADQPLPLTVFGHGIFGTGRDYLLGRIGREIAAPLAVRAGSALIATDWIGLSSVDRDLIQEDIVSDLNRISLVTDRLVQSIINTLTMTELALLELNEDPQVQLGEGPVFRQEGVFYFGVSLGGIQGASLTAVSDRITSSVLSVPGASWSNMLPRSIVYDPIDDLVNLFFPDALFQQKFISLLQARFDPADPINIAQLLAEPLDGMPEKTVIIQEAIADALVPNLSTRMLARAMGARAMLPLVEDAFGVEGVEGPATGLLYSQYLLPGWDDPFPPEDNTYASADNGVHEELIEYRQARDQILDFAATGEVDQPCGAEGCILTLEDRVPLGFPEDD